jgi:hypothetical protein
MKKLFYLSIALLCFIATTSAQMTSKTLQGLWKITALETSGVYFDFSTGLITLDPSLAAQEPVGAEEMKMMADMMKAQLEPYYTNFIQFDNNKITIKYGDVSREGTYTLREQDGHLYIRTAYGTDTVTEDKDKEIEFVIKDNLLYIVSPKGAGDVKMIYKLS